MNERYKKILMWALYAALLVFLSALQSVLFGKTRIFGTKLCLIPVAIACIAMHCGAENGALFGLAAGLFWCFCGADGGALLILSATLAALGTGLLCERWLMKNFVSALILSAGSLLLTQGLLLAFKAYLGQAGGEAIPVLLLQALVSLLAVPPVYLAAWGIAKIYKPQKI